MDSIDAAWLRMDKRTNPMVINGVWVLDGRITIEDYKRLIAERFLIHERFRSVPVEEAIGGVWVEDPYFDLDAHVGVIRLPENATQPDLEALCSELQGHLRDTGIAAEVYGRPKHIYSIYRKMQRKQLAFEQLFDVRAVRVVVGTIPECYAALGVVHGLWHYIPGEFDDYIATPKDNEYRSIHTAVMGPEGKSLEVQIRSSEMHQHA